MNKIRAYYLALVVCSILVILPIWIVDYPPLVDYPNHLARAFIIYNYDKIDAYNKVYNIELQPIPNIAIDIMITLFLNFIQNVEINGKLFLTMTVILLILGCHLLSRSIHGFTWIGLCGPFFVYNSMFLYGFVNFIFGLGMFLITMSLWIKYRKRWNIFKILLISLLVFISYLSHLSSYIFLVIAFTIIVIYDFSYKKDLPNNMVSMVPLLPPFLCFLLFMEGSGEIGEIYWNTIYDKFIGSLSLIINYNYYLDSIILFIIFIITIFVIKNANDLSIKWPIFITACTFGILFLISPKAVFTSFGADVRFVPPTVIFTLMSLRFELSKKVSKFLLIIFLIILMVRFGSIVYYWNIINEKISLQIQLFDYFDKGAKVYPIIILPNDLKKNKIERPIYHIVHYSTIYRQIFSPTLFAIRGQHALTFKEKPEYFFIDNYNPVNNIKWEKIFNNYEYLWCYNINKDFIEYLNKKCHLIASNESSMIYKINK